MYSLVSMLLTAVLAIVAMAGFLRVGQRRLDERVYKDPVLTLKALAEAENRFRLGRDEERRFARSLAELEEAGCITRRLASGDVGGYRYEVVAGEARRWAIAATPAQVTSQALHYYMDHSQLIRARRGGPAGPDDEVFWHPFEGVVWHEAPR